MANNLVATPMSLDTDLASYQAAQTLTAQAELLGLKIRKIALFANASTVAGTVTITDPVTNANLVQPIPVAATLAAGAPIFTDDLTSSLTWADFKVTGLTATKATLLLWWGR